VTTVYEASASRGRWTLGTALKTNVALQWVVGQNITAAQVTRAQLGLVRVKPRGDENA
jgi:hypothetical protein